MAYSVILNRFILIGITGISYLFMYFTYALNCMYYFTTGCMILDWHIFRQHDHEISKCSIIIADVTI